MPADNRERSSPADPHACDCISAILFGAIFSQLVSDFDVIWKWSAGTEFAEPLFGNQIRESPKTEYRSVDGVSFARRRVFDEVTSASGTVMLNERFAGLDFYTTPFSAGPAVAAPFVASHGNKTSAHQKSCDATEGKFMPRLALWQVVYKQSETGIGAFYIVRCRRIGGRERSLAAGRNRKATYRYSVVSVCSLNDLVEGGRWLAVLPLSPVGFGLASRALARSLRLASIYLGAHC